MDTLIATAMYVEEFNQANKPKHSRHCKAAFGRIDMRCHRCLQLNHGAAPRQGWKPSRKEGQRSFLW